MKDFKPMLAAKLEHGSIEGLSFPVLVSPKIDGVRAVVRGGAVLSRSLKPIPNSEVQRLFGRREFNNLDGELFVGPVNATDVFRVTTSCVMSDASVHGVIGFAVFDDFTIPGMPFVERYSRAKNRVTMSPLPTRHLTIVDHVRVASVRELEDAEERFIERGFEGAMIRSMIGPYKFGRSTLNEGSLLKLKRFMDGEATVVGAEELRRNQNDRKLNELGKMKRTGQKAGMVPAGVLGALKVRDVKTGVEFSIGSGFTDSEREMLWLYASTLTGRLVKYRYFPTGSKEKPRFPTFLGFRDARDVS